MASATNQTGSRSHSIAFCGLAVALMTVSAWITIPIGVIPITLQTLAMVFALLVLRPRDFMISLGVYLLIGAIGLPVFSGMRGGIGVFAGPTGGFLWGFVLGGAAALTVARLIRARDLLKEKPGGAENPQRRTLVDAIVAAVFLLVMYVCGWIQLMLISGMGPLEAFFVSIAPFVVFDALKAFVAILAAQAVKQALPQLRQRTAI